MTGLRIAPDVALPVETVTDTLAIFGTRGAGKTSTAVTIVEEAAAVGLPVTVLDPKGDWWGLRAGADGSADGGLPFIVFGGEHADVPLEPTAGAVIADLVADERPSIVIDLSEMSKTKQRQFATDFAERLYRRNRDAVLLVVDEADVLIPQRQAADTMRLLGAWEDVAKRGRSRGLGMLVVTQRPQDVAKSVLDEMHSLILHALIGPRAVKAVRDWIADHDDVEGSRTREVLQSLRSLGPGDGWVWSPQVDLLVRAQVRRITTFDSHATPKPGETRREPKAYAAVDLDALRERIEATVEAAADRDPKVLQQRIAALQTQVADLQHQVEVARDEREFVPALDEDDIGDLRTMVQSVQASAKSLDVALDVIDRILTTASKMLGAEPPAPRPEPTPAPRPIPAPRTESPRPVVTAPPGEVTLSKAQAAILTVLRHRPTEHVSIVAVLTGYSASGGGFRNALGALRTAGYIEGRDPVTITDAGADAIGPVPPLPTGSDLLAYWKAHHTLGSAHGAILDYLATWPRGTSTTVEDVATATGYAPKGGGFRNALGRLRTLGLIHGGVRGEPVHIDEGLID